VVLAARRVPIVDAPLGTALTCDVSDPEACHQLVESAVGLLEPHGGLDTLIFAAAIAPLGSIATTTAEQWQSLLATNLIGAARTVAEALPHLREQPQATVVLLSSHSVGDPWPGLVPYAASKAALNELALGLRSEEPTIRTLRIAIGPTATGFADGWAPDVVGPYFEDWLAKGYLRHAVLEPQETASAILQALDDPGSALDLTVIGAEAG
jgi:NAD(P)-dependent dehydrogenase (short-subunit alcohol dehydrogenase family)